MIRVLIVEDDATIAAAHRRVVDAVEGFGVVEVAANGRAALQACADGGVDLVLLDLGLPDVPGLEVCRVLRGADAPVDVIAVTSARDRDVVRRAVSLGIVQYLVKPFTAAALRERLLGYADYHGRATEGDDVLAQHEVDGLLGALRAAAVPLPKGLTESTLRLVLDALRQRADGTSAAEVAEAIGASRVTARRYLEHLCEIGIAERESVYGAPGRPQQRYRTLERTVPD